MSSTQPEVGAAGVVKQASAMAGKKKTKTKVVRLKQEYIDHLLEHPPKTFHGMPQEMLDEDFKRRGGKLRDIMMSVTASVNKFRDEQLAILEQYRLKGYAEEEIEVDDDDDDAGLGN